LLTARSCARDRGTFARHYFSFPCRRRTSHGRIFKHGRRPSHLLRDAREQERPACARVFDHRLVKSSAVEGGHHLLFQIAARSSARRAETDSGSRSVGDAAREFSEERADLKSESRARVIAVCLGHDVLFFLLFLGFRGRQPLPCYTVRRKWRVLGHSFRSFLGFRFLFLCSLEIWLAKGLAPLILALPMQVICKNFAQVLGRTSIIRRARSYTCRRGPAWPNGKIRLNTHLLNECVAQIQSPDCGPHPRDPHPAEYNRLPLLVDLARPLERRVRFRRGCPGPTCSASMTSMATALTQPCANSSTTPSQRSRCLVCSPMAVR